MVVLRREQSVNWPGLYIDAVGTSPAEAGIGPVEYRRPGLVSSLAGEQVTVHIRFLGAVLLLAAFHG